MKKLIVTILLALTAISAKADDWYTSRQHYLPGNPYPTYPHNRPYGVYQ